MGNKFIVALSLMGLSFGAHRSLANEISEEFYINRSFTASHIAYWSSLEGKRSYLFDFDSLSSSDLKLIEKLEKIERLRIEVKDYPRSEDLPSWKNLAKKGAELVAITPHLPATFEIDTLNKINFRSIVFALQSFPTPAEAKNLDSLETRFSISFFTARYPDYSEIFTFQEFPQGAPLMLSQDYWPGYSHMDLINIVNEKKETPHPIRFRVVNATPSDRNFEVLFKVSGLDSVIYVTDFDRFKISELRKKSWAEIEMTSKKVWEMFGELPLNWTVRGYIPSAKQLLEFAQSEVKKGTRKVTVDLDYPLTSDQKKRLEDLSIPVQRIRAAPNPK